MPKFVVSIVININGSMSQNAADYVVKVMVTTACAIVWMKAFS